MNHEEMFYEVMWQDDARDRRIPKPWWVMQYFRHPMSTADKNASFAANAHYRYWHMVGVKEKTQESLVGQAGEVEPVFDGYCLSFFLFDPATKVVHLPQSSVARGEVTQSRESGYLPIIDTAYRCSMGIEVNEKVIATPVTVDGQKRSIVLVRLNASLSSASAPRKAWLCLAVMPAGPSGFQHRDKWGGCSTDRRINSIEYLPSEARVLVNRFWGPTFDQPPHHFGTYGNGTSPDDPLFYVLNNPFEDLATRGSLNGWRVAVDTQGAGLCSAAFAWDMDLTAAQSSFALDVRLPVDDFRGQEDLDDMRDPTPDDLESTNRSWWTQKLGEDLQVSLPPQVSHLWDLYRTCRANLLILSDHGEIHPGPTVYDSFWIRDSAVEGIACALAGDGWLAEKQFGEHYPAVFNQGPGTIDSAELHGFFGGDAEKKHKEWDSNGQALWAIGRFDRIRGGGSYFGRGLFIPYVLDGARWIRRNRSQYGLLLSGWSAEHLGSEGQPHFWDDFWALAGLREAARLAERIGSSSSQEIWSTYDEVKTSTAKAIAWVLDRQKEQGAWETYIPTGPGDAGVRDSTMIGTLAYFHPCRLYMGAQLGPHVDYAAKKTLETIWGRFMDGGFRHDSAWHCYGPYLTMQLAHAFLLTGNVEHMERCLTWTVWAGSAMGASRTGSPPDVWQVSLGSWNEQHCYPVAKNFGEIPAGWYMGDIPHGWACAEFMLLLRDILFFEADEDGDRQIYIAPGVMPHWVKDDEKVEVSDAPTIFGQLFGYRLCHDRQSRKVTIDITSPAPTGVRYIYPFRFGVPRTATADGRPIPTGNPVNEHHDIAIPAGTRQVVIKYA
ncbi:MAG: hypothetical protein JXR96_12640 [Deltaproteobacteria bacterium]|nr:hypothetical protein [Deltaproteobacteria bacterium]